MSKGRVFNHILHSKILSGHWPSSSQVGELAISLLDFLKIPKKNVFDTLGGGKNFPRKFRRGSKFVFDSRGDVTSDIYKISTSPSIFPAVAASAAVAAAATVISTTSSTSSNQQRGMSL